MTKWSSTCLFAATGLFFSDVSMAWISSSPQRISQQKSPTLLFDSSPKSSSSSETVTTPVDMEDEDAPAGIEGAQFFGGNKQKEEFYDPLAEAQASLETETLTVYPRFEDRAAFTTEAAASVAQKLQRLLNQEDRSSSNTDKGIDTISYASNASWQTAFAAVQSNTPVQELQKARDFYRSLDIAITAGKPISEQEFELRWELAVVWPTFWEPRILFTGTSRVRLSSPVTSDNETMEIQSQIDTLDNPDWAGTIWRQLVPRFWDVYHIGMTPSSEQSPRLPASLKKGLLSQYELHTLPPRLYLQPSCIDLGDREDANAGLIPNHAFSTVVKTMGPQKDVYTPTSPVQVQLVPLSAGDNKGKLELQWKIPLTVEYQARNEALALASSSTDDDSEDDEPNLLLEQTQCEYVWQDQRTVAMVPYGGNPQDAEIGKVRQALYEQCVVKDGLQPALDAQGRPQFWYWQASAKACFTKKGGLGMAVYEWRPALSKSNYVGLELMPSQGN